MSHAKGDCTLPSNLNGAAWTCPKCGNVWSFTPAERVKVPWFGEQRKHIRNPDGSRLHWWQ
jgi:hypothetical protein